MDVSAVADRVLSAVRTNPRVQRALLGAGLGAGAGLLKANMQKNPYTGQSNYARDALLGAALGTSAGALAGEFPGKDNSLTGRIQRKLGFGG